MKILWITNIVFPEAEQMLKGEGTLKSSGGWLLGAAEALINSPELELAIACPTGIVNKLTILNGKKIRYYLFPIGTGNIKYNKDYEFFWREIKDDFHPDVIHIHGTEFSHGLAYVKACGTENVVVSIQGLVSVISDYYLSGLKISEILRNITFRDLIKGTLLHEKKMFELRGKNEIELLKSIKHVIGRTSWDRAHVWAINPNVQYHFCNETLRPEFYNNESWRYEECVPHTIFLSQATYPIKGLHIVLKSMPLILRHYPDTQIRVAGVDITWRKERIKEQLKLSGYGKIIKLLIKKYQLEDKVCFLGKLDADEMINEYLRANVFICPSSIENSPNSLGEAQFLGTPVVASYAGGIPDMMKGDEQHMYRFDDFEMLAKKICEVFTSNYDTRNITKRAYERHNKEANFLSQLEIYKNVAQ